MSEQIASSSQGDTPILVKVQRAAELSGYPKSFIRKTFICEAKRPKNIPPPPPHQHRGRAVYIYAEQLATWVKEVELFIAAQNRKSHRGRPTVAERIARRRQVVGIT